MKSHHGCCLAVPVACALLLSGCSRGAAPPSNAAGQSGVGQTPAGTTMRLSGCVQGAPGGSYELRQIRLEPRVADPQRNTTDTGPAGVTEGAWVRLDTKGGPDLTSYVGQRVTVTGTVVDDGRDTIGTAGADTGAQSRSAESAAGDQAQHHAVREQKEAGPAGQHWISNGRPAQIRIAQVEPANGHCDARR